MSARWDELTDQYNRRKGEAAAAVGMAAAGGGSGASRSATNSGGGGGSGAKSNEVAAAQEAVSISISECEDVLQCRAVFAYAHVPTLPSWKGSLTDAWGLCLCVLYACFCVCMLLVYTCQCVQAMNEAVMRSRREAESAREAARAAARLKTQQAERVDELRQKQSAVRCHHCHRQSR
jgi:hypothetical protein